MKGLKICKWIIIISGCLGLLSLLSIFVDKYFYKINISYVKISITIIVLVLDIIIYKYIKIKLIKRLKMIINKENLKTLINKFYYKSKENIEDTCYIYYSPFSSIFNGESGYYRYSISLYSRVQFKRDITLNLAIFIKNNKIKIIDENFSSLSYYIFYSLNNSLTNINIFGTELFVEEIRRKRDIIKKIISYYQKQYNLNVQQVDVENNGNYIDTFVKHIKLDNNFNQRFIDYLESLYSFWLETHNFLNNDVLKDYIQDEKLQEVEESINSINIFEEESEK